MLRLFKQTSALFINIKWQTIIWQMQLFSDIGQHLRAVWDSHSYIFRHCFLNEGNQWFIFTSVLHLWRVIMLNCNKLKHYGGGTKSTRNWKTGSFLYPPYAWLLAIQSKQDIRLLIEIAKMWNSTQNNEKQRFWGRKIYLGYGSNFSHGQKTSSED